MLINCNIYLFFQWINNIRYSFLPWRTSCRSPICNKSQVLVHNVMKEKQIQYLDKLQFQPLIIAIIKRHSRYFIFLFLEIYFLCEIVYKLYKNKFRCDCLRWSIDNSRCAGPLTTIIYINPYKCIVWTS